MNEVFKRLLGLFAGGVASSVARVVPMVSRGGGCNPSQGRLRNCHCALVMSLKPLLGSGSGVNCRVDKSETRIWLLVEQRDQASPQRSYCAGASDDDLFSIHKNVVAAVWVGVAGYVWNAATGLAGIGGLVAGLCEGCAVAAAGGSAVSAVVPGRFRW